MKREIGESKDHHSNRLFISRSGSMYRSLQERHKKAGIAPIADSLATFRRWLHGQIGTPCEYCQKILTVKECSIDHPTPLSRGGDGTITVICPHDNKAKGQFTREEYTALRESLAALDALFPEGKILKQVIHSLHIANIFRIGIGVKAKRAKETKVATQ